jgi:hypothetical protein
VGGRLAENRRLVRIRFSYLVECQGVVVIVMITGMISVMNTSVFGPLLGADGELISFNER